MICQRWNSGRDSYRPAGEVIRTAEYEVAPIAENVAKSFVVEHHYSHAYPAARFRFGLFHHDQLAGVAVFSHPGSDKVLTNIFPVCLHCARQIRLTTHGWLHSHGHTRCVTMVGNRSLGTCAAPNAKASVELGRFVLLDEVPANGETWFKARCRELLKRERIIGIVSFSDDQPRATSDGCVVFGGHIGTIYQASNAVYLGRATPRSLYIKPDGTVLNDRTIQKIRKQERGWVYATEQLRELGADEPWDDLRAWLAHWLPQLTTRLRHPGNHRYAWALDRSVRLPKSLPYPKRGL